uniref:Ring finger protein 215 n=1 Tax=Acanthochromis polyacanthus TaxID=80966 RepID=A0A3Q1GBK2_9TELE
MKRLIQTSQRCFLIHSVIKVNQMLKCCCCSLLCPQKYLQQLWDTVLLVALILSTGVIVQARWQRSAVLYLQLLPKQDVLKRMSSLKTKTYRQPKPWCEPLETDNCAVCLEPFNNNQCLRVLPCLHEYHRDCVDPWLLLQHTCPLCKRSILSEFTHTQTTTSVWKISILFTGIN